MKKSSKKKKVQKKVQKKVKRTRTCGRNQRRPRSGTVDGAVNSSNMLNCPASPEVHDQPEDECFRRGWEVCATNRRQNPSNCRRAFRVVDKTEQSRSPKDAEIHVWGAGHAAGLNLHLVVGPSLFEVLNTLALRALGRMPFVCVCVFVCYVVRVRMNVCALCGAWEEARGEWVICEKYRV